MNAPVPAPRSAWWRRLLAWLFPRRARRRRTLPDRATPAWQDQLASLPADLRVDLAALALDSDAVRATVTAAVADYVHLRDVLLAADAAPIDDVVLISDAEVTLRAIVARAPSIATVVAVARQRTGERPGRAAAGDALLDLRDDARALHDTASAALEWSASRTAATAARLRTTGDRLRHIAQRADPASRD